jgi:hypothetical protein
VRRADIDRRLEHHAFGQLVDHAAWMSCQGVWLADSDSRPFLSRRGLAPTLGLGDQNIGGALAQIDAHAVAGLEQREPAAGRASGDALRIEGEPDVPDWRPSPMQGSDVMPFLMSAAGGCMFTTSADRDSRSARRRG